MIRRKGRNVAVIIAWIIMSCATMTLFTWFMRRREKRERERALRPRSKSPAQEASPTPSKIEKGKEKTVD